MSTLLITIAVAGIILLIAMAGLGIGWLITGKSRIKLGMCGRDPTKLKKKDCGDDVSCSLCEKKEKK